MLKKKKIANYLKEQKEASVFNELLRLYISDELKSMLQDCGLMKVSLYVTWNENYKCLDVQAKYQDYFYEWQFYQEECEYMIYVDGDEPDEASVLLRRMLDTEKHVGSKRRMICKKGIYGYKNDV